MDLSGLKIFIHKMNLLSRSPHRALWLVAILFTALGIEFRARHVLGGCSVTELYPKPLVGSFSMVASQTVGNLHGNETGWSSTKPSLFQMLGTLLLLTGPLQHLP